MRIGIQYDPRGLDLQRLLDDFERADDEGFDSIWIGQVFDHDALTLLALAGTCTARIELGVSVVPLPLRHPVALAQQALSTQLATRGRLCLGLGFGHPVILEKKLGLPSDRPVARTREALEVLLPLLRGQYVKHAGEFHALRVGVPVAGARAPSVILAALGPRMIELAGERTDGVSLVFAGARFVAERVRPRLPADARIVASLPIALTDSEAKVRTLVDEYTGPSTDLPIYRRTMASQGTERVSDLSCVGDLARVEDALDELEASGVTDLNPILVSGDADPGCAQRTREWLADRARSRRGA